MQVAGAEMLVTEIVRRTQGKLEPTIFCLDGIGPLGEQLRGEGVEVIDLNRRPGLDYRTAWRMSRLIRQRGIELIHAHQYTPFFYAALAKLVPGSRFRLVLTEHGRHYPDEVSTKRRLTNRWLLGPLADAITGVCQFSLQGLAEQDGFSRQKMSVIGNGIQLDRYKPAGDRDAIRVRLQLDPSRRYVGNIARFHPVKDQAMLLPRSRRSPPRRPMSTCCWWAMDRSAARSRTWCVRSVSRRGSISWEFARMSRRSSGRSTSLPSPR